MADRDLRIRMLLEAADRVSRPLRDIAGGNVRAAQTMRVTRDRLKEIDRAQRDIAGFRELKAGTRAAELAMKTAQARVNQLGRELAQTANPTRKLTREFEQARGAAQRLEREHGDQVRRLGEVRDRLQAAGVSTRDLARHERELRQEAARTNSELAEQARRLAVTTDRQRRFAAARDQFGRGQQLAGSMAVGGMAAVGTGAAIGRPLVGVIADAQRYQSAMTDIAQKGDLTRAQANQLGKELLVAARHANQLPEAMQGGVDTLMGLGASVPDAAAMVPAIGRASTAYKAEMADMAAATWAVKDNLKVTAGETAKVIDVMAQTGKRGAFEMKDMAGAFPALTAAYQGLGQKGVGAVADLAAGLQIARKGAGDSATAGTNLANILQKIASPATNKAFAKMGVDLPAALKKAYREGKTPLEAITELTNKTLNGDLSRLGYLFEDAQVQAGLRPLIQNFEEFKRIRAEAMAASGTTDRDFAERMRDSAERTKALQIRGQALAVQLGELLLPAVERIAIKVGQLADRFSAFAEQHPGVAKALLLTAGGIAAMLLVLGVLGVAAGGVVGPLYLFGAAAKLAGMGMLPFLGTVLLVIAAVAALAIAAYAIYQNWGAISGFFAELWNAIAAKVGAAAQAIVAVFSGMWAGVKSAFSISIGDLLGRLAYFVGYALGTLFRFGGRIFAWFTGTLPGLLSSGWQAAWSGLTGAITAAGTWLTTALPRMLANGWVAAWNAFRTAMRVAFVTLPRLFFDFGAMIVQGLWNGIKSAPGRLWNAGVRMAKSLSGGFKAANKIQSPSRVFMELGGHVMSGLGLGLAQGENGPLGRMQGLSTRLAKAVAIGASVPLTIGATAASAGSPGSMPVPRSAQALAPITIHVHGAPGQSAEVLARAVAEELDRRERASAAAARSTLADREDDWS